MIRKSGMEYINTRKRLAWVFNVTGLSWRFELQYRVKTWFGYQWVCVQWCPPGDNTINQIIWYLERGRALDKKNVQAKRYFQKHGKRKRTTNGKVHK